MTGGRVGADAELPSFARAAVVEPVDEGPAPVSPAVPAVVAAELPVGGQAAAAEEKPAIPPWNGVTPFEPVPAFCEVEEIEVSASCKGFPKAEEAEAEPFLAQNSLIAGKSLPSWAAPIPLNPPAITSPSLSTAWTTSALVWSKSTAANSFVILATPAFVAMGSRAAAGSLLWLVPESDEAPPAEAALVTGCEEEEEGDKEAAPREAVGSG